MPPYIYPVSATSILLSFSDLLLDPHPNPSSDRDAVSGNHATHLNEATASRSRLREVLKNLGTESGADGIGGARKDWRAAVQATEEYLPLLMGLMDCLESDELLIKQEPTFQWRSMINPTSSFPGNSSLSSLPTYASESLFVHLIHATSMVNAASTLLTQTQTRSTSSTTKQPTPILSTADTHRNIDALSRAADLLCRASGVFEYVADTVLPRWEVGMRANGNGPGGGRSSGGVQSRWKGKGRMPAECSRDVVRGLSLMALADAQALAVQKLLAPYDPSSTLLPLGPPLAKGHPSPGLLAKLHIHIAALYASARNSIKTGSTAASGTGPGVLSRSRFSSSSSAPSIDSHDTDAPSIDGEIDPGLLDYLKKESALAEVRGRKWLGVEAGEYPGGEKVGLAVAWLKLAEGMSDDLRKRGDVKGGGSGLKSKMKGLKIGGGDKETRKERKGRTEREAEEIEAYLKAYEKMNRSVTFQPIPPAASLQSLLPGGRPVLQVKPYVPPTPAFGPALETSRSRTDEEREEGRSAGPSAAGQGYAGAGSYF